MRRLALLTTAAALSAAGPAAAMPMPPGPPPTPPTRPMAAMAMAAAPRTPRIAADVRAARLATTAYVTNLARAKAHGYKILTRMMPGMGFHFMNPAVKGFDVRRPAILVYERNRSGAQLAALEWVFTSRPARKPLPGARYGSFPAACHYADGTFVTASAQALCPVMSPHTGAAFGFWHPRLVTLHFWVWFPNPAGMFHSTNPLVR